VAGVRAPCFLRDRLGFLSSGLRLDALSRAASTAHVAPRILCGTFITRRVLPLISPTILRVSAGANVGGGTTRAVVFGFRTKVEF
jgi:hypothetical protein